jgi:drug/metabolite transporter (DMT)-like permease
MSALFARLEMIPVRTRAYVGLCFASIAWASAFILGKVVLAEIAALPAGAWRHAIAAMVLLPFAWRGRRSANVRAALAPLAVMVICGGVLYPWTFFAALSRTSATNTSLLIALNPALTLLLAPLVGEAYTRRGLLGVSLALLGAVLVITHGDLSILTSLAAARPGDLLAVVAAGLWATFNIASRRVVAHLPHAMTNAVVYGLGCVALFVLAGPEQPWQQVASASPRALAALGGMVVLSSLMAGQLFLFGVHSVGVGRTVVFVYIVPVLTAVASALFLGESLVPAQVAGGAAVLAGVYVTTRAPREERADAAAIVAPASRRRLAG